MSMATSSTRYTDLYDYARAAEQVNNDLTGQGGRLNNRLSHFEATCREPGFRVGGDNLGGGLQSYSAWAMPIDRHVRKVGEDFQRADGVWQTAPKSWLPGWWDKATSWAEGFGDWWKWIAALSSLGAYLVMTWSTAGGYVGKTLVYGPGLARQLLGLSPHLSHIKAANLLGHMGNSVWVVGPWFLVGAIIESAGQWMKDIKEYQGDLVRMINAITIDTEVTFATMGVAAAATLKIAGAIVAGVGIGGTAGPILVAVGVGLVVGLAADWMLDKFYESDFRRDAIEWLTDREHDVVNFFFDVKDQAADKWHDFVGFLDAQVDKFMGDEMQPLPVAGPVPVPRPTPVPPAPVKLDLPPKPVITPRPIQHLSQLNPEGGEILNYTRFENPPDSDYRQFEPGIVTVKDHIKQYGCLMTDYTMLLRGQGFDTEVTDLYLTKVERSGVIDTTNKSVTLFDLYTGPEIANEYLERQGINTQVEQGYLTGFNDAERLQNLEEKLLEVGSLVLHVQGAPMDGHWIVVTHTDDGSLVVLDPLKSAPSTISEYQLFDDEGEFHYLKDKSAT